MKSLNLNKMTPYMFLAPAGIIMILGLLYPIGYMIYASFLNWNPSQLISQAEWVGLRNYTNLLADASFRESFFVTIKFAIIVVVLEMFIGVGLALLLDRDIRGMSLLRTIFILPNEAGVKAAQALKKIVDCGPEGSRTFGFAEAGASFLQGKTAMFLDSTVFAGKVNDPKSSKVVGKIAWAPHPKGVRRGSQTGGFGIGIPKNAKNKEAAFLLMQWLTSKKADKLIALAGGNPSRYSTHQDAQVNAKFPHMKTFGEALKYADPDWRPIIPVWGKINADLGTTLSKVLTEDLDIKKALDGVAARSKAVMQEAGYYTWK